jgi:hypothetical protein
MKMRIRRTKILVHAKRKSSFARPECQLAALKRHLRTLKVALRAPKVVLCAPKVRLRECRRSTAQFASRAAVMSGLMLRQK